ncbi:MAG: hypothetical protein AAB151_05785 [Nitrospirota bacterium]
MTKQSQLEIAAGFALATTLWVGLPRLRLAMTLERYANMKRFFSWQIVLGISLIALSAIFYLIHYLIFRDAHHIFVYLIGDIAFVPVEVLLVTLIIHRLLEVREKRAMLKKLNMAVGAFFSEVGTILLKSFSGFDPQSDRISKKLVMAGKWSGQDFLNVSRQFKDYDCRIECGKYHLENLKGFLAGKRRFLLTLLQNPNLLEHESFTELLWAVFHLTDELTHRADLGRLPDTDYKHLAGDIKRAYVLLITEWLAYMKHLKEDYPYLFSLAMRTNPFDPNASAEVK